jgi:7,8-dihydropterin-6-yl-methyl-4-(beta-D-ribofuranosyl)aminobenzene 5'-phosphate synthase
LKYESLFDHEDHKKGSRLNPIQKSAHGKQLLDIISALLLPKFSNMDHFGGLLPLVERVGKKNLKLILHPTAFRKPRYIKVSEDFNINLPPLKKETISKAGVEMVESTDPRLLVDGLMLFLGEVPKLTDFEKGFARTYYDEDGQSHWDPIEDDTAIVANVRGKGLVVISGCAHSGIINTVKYAQKTSGIDKIYVVMGGFHLSGADFGFIDRNFISLIKALNILNFRYLNFKIWL